MIFTIDAIIALGIFLSSTLLFYSFFTSSEGFGLRSPVLYSDTQYYFGSYDFNGAPALAIYSVAYKDFQKGMGGLAVDRLALVASAFDFPSNIRILIWDGADFEEAFSFGNNTFKDQISIKRYLILDVIEDLPTEQNLADMPKSKILAGVNSTYYFNLTNNLVSAADVHVNLIFSNGTHEFDYVLPPGGNNYTIPAGETIEIDDFEIHIPEDAVIGEYYLVADTTGDFTDTSDTTINIIKFGLLEVETGYE